MKTIKRGFFVLICLIVIYSITSCAYTSMSQVVYLNNGDAIKVTLETTNGYKFNLYEDGRLEIRKGSQVLSTFLLTSGWYFFTKFLFFPIY